MTADLEVCCGWGDQCIRLSFALVKEADANRSARSGVRYRVAPEGAMKK